MADNVTVDNAALTDYTVATDDVGAGVQVQYVKLDVGGNGVQSPAVTNVPTKELRSTTGTQTSVASSASNVTLLASNANRLGVVIYNDSTQNLFVKLGATASSSSFAYFAAPGGHVEIPYGYTGQIDGIWASANGNARVTELT